MSEAFNAAIEPQIQAKILEIIIAPHGPDLDKIADVDYVVFAEGPQGIVPMRKEVLAQHKEFFRGIFQSLPEVSRSGHTIPLILMAVWSDWSTWTMDMNMVALLASVGAAYGWVHVEKPSDAVQAALTIDMEREHDDAYHNTVYWRIMHEIRDGTLVPHAEILNKAKTQTEVDSTVNPFDSSLPTTEES